MCIGVSKAESPPYLQAPPPFLSLAGFCPGRCAAPAPPRFYPPVRSGDLLRAAFRGSSAGREGGCLWRGSHLRLRPPPVAPLVSSAGALVLWQPYHPCEKTPDVRAPGEHLWESGETCTYYLLLTYRTDLCCSSKCCYPSLRG